jgi:ankyrin repeat protein
VAAQVEAVVDLLIGRGANVNARAEGGATPLHHAARGRLAVVTALLRAGADPRARTANGRTPLHAAAAETRDPAVIDALIAAGADVEARETIVRNGRVLPLGTPLYHAAGNENVAALDALLAAGASVEAAWIHNGVTALHAAAWTNDNPAVIELLLAAGANLEARDDWGRTPLHRAADYHDTASATEALLAAGANGEARDEDGKTPLHLAAQYVNRYPWEGMPENLQHAGDAIGALLDAGANPNATDAAGRTPWDVAQENEKLRGSDAYWRMNEARFDASRQESRRPPAAPPGRRQAASQGPACELPGFPTPANVQSLGLNWCGPNVGFQRRAFALQAAGAWCAIDIGSSSTAEQISARHQEINAACDTLDAMQSPGNSDVPLPGRLPAVNGMIQALEAR